MNTIKVLDDNTINKIAAGEVVERPASVVKELCENAIDAKATSISVEIKDGGINYIRVSDNGFGIDKDSIRTAFLRHATSKITSIEDLFCISSLGFRGEALSSIAAVSRVEVMTRRQNDIIGSRYRIEGGRELSFDDAGLPVGTTFIVRNLFFNTPARQKFLKSPMSEANTITELMERLVLSHPDIAFKYIVNGREKIVSAGLNDIKQSVYSVFGRDITSKLVPIQFESGNITITGFAGKPEIGRGSRNYELFYVNNRFIKSNILSKACEEAYNPFLMLHRFPFVLMYISIPSGELDVNVHPAKTEIKFLNEKDVYDAVYSACLEAVTKRELIPAVTVKNTGVILNSKENSASDDISVKVSEDESVITMEKAATAEAADATEDTSLFSAKNEAAGAAEDTNILTSPDIADAKLKTPQERHAPEPFETKKSEEFKNALKQENEQFKDLEAAEQITLFSEGFLDKKERSKQKIIGQVFNTYWIVEYEDKMYIIDQHAAHEKVLYEKFKKRIEQNEIFSQNISPPIIVNLSVSEALILNEYLESFTKLGFKIESFGGNDFAITAIPTDLFNMTVNDYFTAVLDDLCENKRVRTPIEVAERIATMACKAAIKGNMHITATEADSLFEQLLTLDNPYNCPHGRPTIISYSKQELEKLFKRIV